MTRAEERWLEYVLTVFAAIAIGLLTGLVYTAVAGAIYLIQGPLRFSANGVSFVDLTKAYTGGFGAAGAVVGLLIPLARWAIGAALVGLIAAVPAVALIAVTADGWPLDRSGVITVGIMSLIFGPTLGLYMWNESRKS